MDASLFFCVKYQKLNVDSACKFTSALTFWEARSFLSTLLEVIAGYLQVEMDKDAKDNTAVVNQHELCSY